MNALAGEDALQKRFIAGIAVGLLAGIPTGWFMHKLRRTYLDKKRAFFEKQLKKTEDQIRKDNLLDTDGRAERRWCVY